MADLVQAINKDGTTTASAATKKKETAGNTNLGKDEFLKLLVCQMQNQNPLEPASDTEWIAQLANFSSLETMQNMSGTMTGLQGMNMVGTYVDIVSKSSDGKTVEVSGYVDYVNVADGKTKVCVDGKLYDSADVKNVYQSEEDAIVAKIQAGLMAEEEKKAQEAESGKTEEV